jgi:hypothetical protein
LSQIQTRSRQPPSLALIINQGLDLSLQGVNVLPGDKQSCVVIPDNASTSTRPS